MLELLQHCFSFWLKLKFEVNSAIMSTNVNMIPCFYFQNTIATDCRYPYVFVSQIYYKKRSDGFCVSLKVSLVRYTRKQIY